MTAFPSFVEHSLTFWLFYAKWMPKLMHWSTLFKVPARHKVSQRYYFIYFLNFDWPMLRQVIKIMHDLRSVLALTNYYRRNTTAFS